MNSVILHISDLHVSMNKDFSGNPLEVKSYLDTNADTSNCILFSQIFINFLKEEINKNSKIYLLITGDITESGEKIEFKFAFQYLKKIIEELNIDYDNILLIPGDHDLTRREIVNHFANEGSNTLEEINSIKFKNFQEFYKELLNKDFDPNKVIVNNLIIEDKIQLIGVNSCYNIDLNQKLGFIPISEFETELLPYTENKKIKNILCCHHNLLSSYEDKKSGQWVKDNRKILISNLQENSINFILSGNEHTSSLKKHPIVDLYVSDSGALTSKKHDAAFKIYEIYTEDDIILKNKIYGLIRTGDFDKDYHWDIRNNKRSNQDDELKIFIKPVLSSTLDIDVLPQKSHEVIETEEPVQVEEEISLKKYENEYYSQELYNKIRELNAFHTGHFHWSESSRAHNWIDISKLIENKDNLQFLKNAIIDVLDTQIKNENIDLIIGLGYEGNILATKAAIKYNKPYSFLPYSYRHDEHHEMENQLNFDNTDGQFKNVLIITDVVNDGRTIRKLINKRQKEFFDSVEKIYVISLLYTGSSELNHNILNVDHLRTLDDYTITEDDIINKIEYYAVKKFKVEKCPYGNNFRTECLIYKDELSCVNLFYDENKYKEAIV